MLKTQFHHGQWNLTSKVWSNHVVVYHIHAMLNDFHIMIVLFFFDILKLLGWLRIVYLQFTGTIGRFFVFKMLLGISIDKLLPNVVDWADHNEYSYYPCQNYQFLNILFILISCPILLLLGSLSCPTWLQIIFCNETFGGLGGVLLLLIKVNCRVWKFFLNRVLILLNLLATC